MRPCELKGGECETGNLLGGRDVGTNNELLSCAS